MFHLLVLFHKAHYNLHPNHIFHSSFGSSHEHSIPLYEMYNCKGKKNILLAEWVTCLGYWG